MTRTTPTKVFLHCGALPNDLVIHRVDGTESISAPFIFDISLNFFGNLSQLDNAVGSEAQLTIQRGRRRIVRSGVLAEIERHAQLEDGTNIVRLRLVPRLWQLSLSHRSRYFQGLELPQILAQCLAEIDTDSCPIEFRLTRTHPTRETVTQYEESDLDFVSRLMEQAGICYFFTSDGDHQRLVVTDDTSVSESYSKQTFFYCPKADDLMDESGVIRELYSRTHQLPRQVILSDYDEFSPQTPLEGSAEVDPAGQGVHCEYNAGFQTPAEGQALAKIRAEELKCRQTTVTGRGTALALSPGAIVTIESSAAGPMQEKLFVALVNHQVDRCDELDLSYHCEFVSHPANIPFRPQRRTPRPRVFGALSAHTDGSGARADMDEHGRYRVRLPFAASGGEPTGFLRMAQPWAGLQQGMHFPLEPGTEVLWSCFNGDPDRPVITGAVPNPLKPSVVNRQTQERSVIKARGGASIEFGSMERESSRIPSSQLPLDNEQPLLSQRHQWDPPDGGADLTGAVGTTQNDSGTNKNFKIKVPNYDTGGADCYVRLGVRDHSEDPERLFTECNSGTETNSEPDIPDDEMDGAFDYTDGNRIEMTAKNKNVVIGGTSRFSIGGGSLGVWDAGTCYFDSFEQIGTDLVTGNPLWRKVNISHVSSTELAWGDKEEVFAGFTFEAKLGLAFELFIGANLNISVASTVELEAGVKSSMGATISRQVFDIGCQSLSADAETTGLTSNKINIKTMTTAGSRVATAVGAVLGGVGGATLGLALGGTAAGTQYKSCVSSPVIGCTTAAISAINVGFTIDTLVKWLAQKSLPVVTEIELDPTSIKMGLSDLKVPGIEIGPTGVKISAGPQSFIELTPLDCKITTGSFDAFCLNDINLTGTNVSVMGTGKVDFTAVGLMNIKSTAGVKVDSDALIAMKSGASFTQHTTVGVIKGNWLLPG